jgi:nucleotide-binding universal stress UspA family protein
MNVVIGIDSTPSSHDAAALVAAMWPRGLRVSLVNAIPSVLPDAATSPAGAASPMIEVRRSHEKAAWEAIDEARDRLRLEEAGIESHLEWGPPAERLLAVAEAQRADLIAVGSTRKSALGSLFVGSVSREVLRASPVSVLVAKRPAVHPDGLVAVFATDHSEYANECLDELVRLAPTGLRRLVVLTSNEIDATKVGVLIHDLPALADRAEGWITERLVQENRRIAERLAALGPRCEAAVKEMPVNAAIRLAMDEYQADLLIVGAHGHGFFERFFLGSVSFHQVANEPYSVLVLRPRGARG